MSRPHSPTGNDTHRPVSPITIEHRGNLFLTATGQLPKTQDCANNPFCRCDVCSRLNDLGYESIADYYDTIHRKSISDQEIDSAVLEKKRARMERIRRRTDGTLGDSKEEATFISLHSTIVVKPMAIQSNAPSPRLSPTKRDPLPRTAGRVIARHDIFAESKEKTRQRISGNNVPRSPFKITKTRSPKITGKNRTPSKTPSPIKTPIKTPRQRRGRTRTNSSASSTSSSPRQRRNSRSASPAPRRTTPSSSSSPSSNRKKRSPSPHSRSMPWESSSEKKRSGGGSKSKRINQRIRKNTTTNIKRKLDIGSNNGNSKSAFSLNDDAPLAPTTPTTTKPPLLMLIPEPTLENSKEELIAFIYAARTQGSNSTRSGSRTSSPKSPKQIKRQQIAKEQEAATLAELKKSSNEIEKMKKMLNKLLLQNQKLKKTIEKEKAVSNSLVTQCSALKNQLKEVNGRNNR